MMSNLVMLKWRPFEYKAKFSKRLFLFRSKIGIFDKLQISNCKSQTRATISHKMAALKGFTK